LFVSLRDAIAFGSGVLTFAVQIIAAYLITLAVGAAVRNARIQQWLWSVFVYVSAGVWFAFLWNQLMSGASVTKGSSGMASSRSLLRWTWDLESGFLPYAQPIVRCLAFIYIAGLVYFLIQFCIRAWRLRGLINRASVAPEELQSTFSSLCANAGVGSASILLVSGIRSPATVRWWRPRVLIPLELLPHIRPDQIVDMMRHELVHVQRRDYLFNCLASFSARVLFFHPFAWLAFSRIRRFRELACDDGVVASDENRRLDYAESLISLARWMSLRREFHAGALEFSGGASLLTDRLQALLSESNRKQSVIRKLSWAACLVAGVICVMMTVPQLQLALALPQKIISGDASGSLSAADLLTSEVIASQDQTTHRTHAIRVRRVKTAQSLNDDAPLVVQAPNLLAPPSGLLIPDLAPLAAGPRDPNSTDPEDEQGLPPLRNSGSEFAVRDRTPIRDEEPELSAKTHHATKWRKVAGVAAVAAAAVLLGRADRDDQTGPHLNDSARSGVHSSTLPK
jgi:beta-lactamase regulating signal transducer with metallopeptidase domain